jgi:hypothetical protein
VGAHVERQAPEGGLVKVVVAQLDDYLPAELVFVVGLFEILDAGYVRVVRHEDELEAAGKVLGDLTSLAADLDLSVVVLLEALDAGGHEFNLPRGEYVLGSLHDGQEEREEEAEVEEHQVERVEGTHGGRQRHN